MLATEPSTGLSDDTSEIPIGKTARSRITNGSKLLPSIDGRSLWARRLRDVIAAFVSDKGGVANVSEGKRSIIRRIATLTVELEHLEARMALQGCATADELDLYQRTSNTLRRHIESIGLEREARDTTPSLSAYLASKQSEAA